MSGQGPGDHRAGRSQGGRSQASPPAAGKSDESKPLASPEQTEPPGRARQIVCRFPADKSGESKPVVSPGKVNAPGRVRQDACGFGQQAGTCHQGQFVEAEGRKTKGRNGEERRALAAASNRPAKTRPRSRTEAKPFLFRTERVEPDTQLVDQLEAAKVTFSGVRPSFLSQFLYAWVLPIGVMVVIWVFLSRGLRTAGQSVMSFGKSRARLVADRDTGVTFDDVAGCDEAKYELQEVVDFLKNPGPLHRAWAPGFPRACCWWDCPAPGKRCSPVRSPARPKSLSSR